MASDPLDEGLVSRRKTKRARGTRIGRGTSGMARFRCLPVLYARHVTRARSPLFEFMITKRRKRFLLLFWLDQRTHPRSLLPSCERASFVARFIAFSFLYRRQSRRFSTLETGLGWVLWIIEELHRPRRNRGRRWIKKTSPTRKAVTIRREIQEIKEFRWTESSIEVNALAPGRIA